MATYTFIPADEAVAANTKAKQDYAAQRAVAMEKFMLLVADVTTKAIGEVMADHEKTFPVRVCLANVTGYDNFRQRWTLEQSDFSELLEDLVAIGWEYEWNYNGSDGTHFMMLTPVKLASVPEVKAPAKRWRKRKVAMPLDPPAAEVAAE